MDNSTPPLGFDIIKFLIIKFSIIPFPAYLQTVPDQCLHMPEVRCGNNFRQADSAVASGILQQACNGRCRNGQF